MATLPRFAKPGNPWGSNELEAYNINITFQQDAEAFFDAKPLPPPSVHHEILTAPTADEASYKLLSYLNLAMTPEELAVSDFVVALFYSLGYIHRPRVIRARKELGFLTCGEVKSANLDVCIIDH